MSDLKEVKAGLTEAGSAVQAARALLNQGSLIDLSGLEVFVKDLCGSVEELPADQGGAIKSDLIKLIDDLNGLADVITAERDSVASEMKTLSDSKRAASAYGTGADSSSKPPRK
jgi:hypothetical protein